MTTIPSELTDRLTLSRDRMRLALQGGPSTRGDAAAGEHSAGRAMPWLNSLKSLPFAGILVDAVSGWWAQHPLRIAAIVGSNAAQVLVQPIAQRNPLGLVLGTVVLGGLVVWSRPWRWLLKPALFAGLAPQLLRSALAQIPAQPPAQPSANRSKNA